MARRLRVAVEAQSLSRDKSGVGSYLAGVLGGWSKDKRWPEINLLLQGGSSEVNREYGLRFPTKNLTFSRRITSVMRKAGVYPPLDRAAPGYDVYFYPDFVRWKQNSGKSVLMVHDFTYLHFPDTMDQKNQRYLEKYVPRSIEQSDWIVVNSQATKNDLLDHYEFDKKKITVIYPGVNFKKYRPQTIKQTTKVKDKYKLDDNYILFVGTLEPRKNVVGLIEAYAGLPEKVRQKYQLVLAGNMGWMNEEINASLKGRANLNIKVTGYVEEKDLPAMYSGAQLFVFPSLFEGFGMPVVEAMACGTPVITSDVSSLPEAAGSAAILVQPADIAALSNKMEEVLSFENVHKDLVNKGLRQAKKFTWEESAIKLKEVFQQAHKL